MKCPSCGVVDQSKVTDSRQHLWTIKRKRTCLSCQHRFTTFEVHEDDFFRYQDRQTIQWSEQEYFTLVELREKGLKHKQIAEVLGRSKQSVDMKIHRLLTSEEYFLILDEIENKGEGVKIK